MKETHNGIVLKKMTYNGQKVKKWKHNGVLVYSAGNIVTYYVDGVFYQEEVESGNSVLSPTTFTPSKTGYTFIGWSLSEGGAVLSEYVMDSDPITLYAIMIQTVTSYSYNGGVQSFTAPVAGTYLLQVWGAQGDSSTSSSAVPGYGGYSAGQVELAKGQIIYICVGGMPARWSGGYNGGGHGFNHNGYNGGGGATHMAKTNRGVLSSYYNYKSEVYLVAGGGGGAGYGPDANGGVSGMGLRGGNGGGGSGSAGYGIHYSGYNYGGGEGGTQTGGGRGGHADYPGQFGQGGQSASGTNLAGGGGGWYGGGVGGAPEDDYGGAGGGSGYIGGVTKGSMRNGSRSGNGYASVTFVST